MAEIDVSKYAYSPVHKAVVLKDYAGLKEILARLPRLGNPYDIHTEAESIAEEEKAEAISAVVDYRDVPNRDTPLHLAAKLGDEVATEMLLVAGAEKNLKNKQGWSALSEAILNNQEKVGLLMVRHSWNHLDEKWHRRVPRYIAAMQRMRDFYMEITFHFESSVIPFISRIAPSDTYKIWKRGGNMRADMTLAGFDGLKIKRSDQSMIFFGDGLEDRKMPPGSLCFMSHKDKKILTFSSPATKPTGRQVRKKFKKKSEDSIVNVGIDMSQAFLVPQLTWRRKERKEIVGPWKAKVYDMHNVNLSVKSVKGPRAKKDDKASSIRNKNESKDIQDMLTEEERKQLESALAQNVDSLESNNEDRLNQKEEEKKEKKGHGRKEKGTKKGKHIKAPSMDSGSSSFDKEGSSESEYKRGMRPSLWLSPNFPLKVEELLPLLNILADKVKAVRRLRELLTTKFPKDTFPVKVAIPVIPTVRVLVSFTKFEELPPLEEFSSAPTSPTSADDENPEEQPQSSSWFQWVKANPSSSADSNGEIQDLFAIPSDYTWTTLDAEKSKKTEKS
ncbi:ankyrin repeat domain-containing protein 13C [Neltuma alba]|uniref:ankyrin repeat domain-containing protein 13C n=1 Tax=Neltuma alba TaxID=207710 RepID=UPI0010A2B14A|nr:ankyrin repeat domain-containing protein 13C-like [Prosopis alba]XP_028773473.1 ankyrin repeat domain-containing protein 13C-like [Prosopis alba]XP_028773474.1 ankyrin repeat domain-containing protein 13C-like [Prosopis alba]